MVNQLSRSSSVAIIAVLTGVIGYAAATLNRAEPATDRTDAALAQAEAATALLLERVGLLEEELRAEQKRSEKLRSDVSWMSTRLEATAAGVETLLEDAAAEIPAAPAPVRAAPAPRPNVAEPSTDDGEDALVEAGFDPGAVDAYRARVADLQMERLYLADQAAREGWINSERFREENQALSEKLYDTREDYGEDLHDWALYSSGRPNRAQVASVIAGSPAANAGIQAGDVIFTYGRDRVLGVSDLHLQTRAGRLGDSTRVEILRGNRTVQVVVPRGPLGVRLRGTRMAPPRIGS